ncbi:MAG: aldehyde dehydrogenase family protein [Acidipropionibacterium sp.]|jgi:aldehyde dehydrogenase (NAD+)/betaine-aldehyde dehydrogenase|nr:aldehyde dehydrogenase family protein [Acidipropionibacterium sp.]
MNSFMKKVGAFVGGRTVFTGQSLPIRDPSTGEVFAELTECDGNAIDSAVDAARGAFDREWRRTSAGERAVALNRVADAIRGHSDELTRIESRDTGNPLRQARVDVDFAERYFRYYANMVEAVFGDVIPGPTDRLTMTIREPFGVTGHIIPWNYPLGIGTRTIAPALAAGNCCVLKPAEDASMSCVRLAELAFEAGLPAGVLNVITGTGATVGAALAAHPGISRVAFTGSVPVGISVAQAAAVNLVPADLELGGKSANIVFADADLETAIPAVAQSILQNAGQTCSAGSRVLIDARVHDEVVQRLVQIFEGTKLGAGIDDPDMGPVISEKQRDRVLDYISEGEHEAELVTGGAVPPVVGSLGGYFVQPTIFDQVGPSARISREEIFGPVLAATTFDTEDEAVSLANASDYGLVAGVWTVNGSRAMRLVRDLQVGQVLVNTYSNGVELPFSGRKCSGYGLEKGFDALRAFTQVKGAVVMMKAV